MVVLGLLNAWLWVPVSSPIMDRQCETRPIGGTGFVLSNATTSSQEEPMPAATAIRHKRGGLYFEDFVVGECVEHRYSRTVTQMDNMLFSNMTLNPQPLHIDR